MLRSLLHHQSSALLGLVSLAAMVFSLEVYADKGSNLASARVMVMNVGALSSEDLMSNADHLGTANNPLDESELNQRLMHSQWLEAGMTEAADYREGDDALEELAENAIKHYWDALVERDKSYDLYTPVVEGNFSASRGGADYGVRLSGNTLKFRVEYTF